MLAERHRAMSWAQRVFKLDLQSCAGCGGQVRLIAGVDDPAVIGKILHPLETRGPERVGADRPGRAAPVVLCSARK